MNSAGKFLLLHNLAIYGTIYLKYICIITITAGYMTILTSNVVLLMQNKI